MMKSLAMSEQKGKMKTLLLWSGGFDSTAMLINYLSRECPIRTIAVNHSQVVASEAQKITREVIKEKLIGLGYKWDHHELTLPSNAWEFNDCNGVPQPMLWLSLAVAYLGSDEDLVLAWVKGDDVWHYKQEVNQIFDSMQIMLGKTGKLDLPFEFATKWDLMKSFKDWKEVLDLSWFCEWPVKLKDKSRRCGKCTSCLTHKTALWRYSKMRTER